MQGSNIRKSSTNVNYDGSDDGELTADDVKENIARREKLEHFVSFTRKEMTTTDAGTDVHAVLHGSIHDSITCSHEHSLPTTAGF